MTLGPTHYRWRADVRREVAAVRSAFPRLTVNTYLDHPWPGWDGRSFDVWDSDGRGDPLPDYLAVLIRDFVISRPGAPFIRHWILNHTLWTSFGGQSYWRANDHTGRLRHFHVTFW